VVQAAEVVQAVEVEATELAEAGRSPVGIRRADGVAGSARWVLHRRVAAALGSARSVPQAAEGGAGSVVSPGRAEAPCHANRARRGVAAVSSPAQSCLTTLTFTPVCTRSRWSPDVAILAANCAADGLVGVIQSRRPAPRSMRGWPAWPP